MTLTALILAAGQSKRMGQPKMLLPWGETTVLGKVIETVQAAGVEEILVVTGGSRAHVEQIVAQHSVCCVHNPDYNRGEMLSSIQAGLRALLLTPHLLPASSISNENEGRETAALICLGDQPQIEVRSVSAIIGRFRESGAGLIVPSFQMRRGHPWLAARPLWDELLSLQPPQSPRNFLNAHAREIEYVNVDTPSVLADLDTPEDYERAKPSA